MNYLCINLDNKKIYKLTFIINSKYNFINNSIEKIKIDIIL